jgi:DNA gyrase inhibitor GyrI
MKAMDVRIVRLEPFHVASALGFGTSPEAEAWARLLGWAREKGVLAEEGAEKAAVRFFGFNNPSPSPGSPNYGYEQWMTVEPDTQGDDEIMIKEFSGGLYAVTRCELRNIGEAWKALLAWCEASPHRWAPNHHQWLEESITPPAYAAAGAEDAVFDLYLPVAE